MSRYSPGFMKPNSRPLGVTLALAGIALGAIPPDIATAQDVRRVPCGSRDAILQHLSTAFDEEPVAIALDAQGRVIEILAAETGSWTMLLTMPNGITCLVGSGEAFEILPASIDGPAV